MSFTNNNNLFPLRSWDWHHNVGSKFPLCNWGIIFMNNSLLDSFEHLHEFISLLRLKWINFKKIFLSHHVCNNEPFSSCIVHVCILKLVRHNTAPTTNWIKNILLFSSVPTKTWNTNVEISHQMLKPLAILQINYQIWNSLKNNQLNWCIIFIRDVAKFHKWVAHLDLWETTSGCQDEIEVSEMKF